MPDDADDRKEALEGPLQILGINRTELESLRQLQKSLADVRQLLASHRRDDLPHSLAEQRHDLHHAVKCVSDRVDDGRSTAKILPALKHGVSCVSRIPNQCPERVRNVGK